MTLIIKYGKYYDYIAVCCVTVNENREVISALYSNNSCEVSLGAYAGCDATLVVGNRNELLTIVK